MYDKLYHILVCQHVDCRVVEYECHLLTDSEDSAKKFIETKFVDGDPHITYCMDYLGECDDAGEGTWIPVGSDQCEGSACRVYWFDDDDQVE